MEKRDELFYQPKNGYDRIDLEERLALDAYCEDYKAYLNASRTEREAVREAISQAETLGFRAYEYGMDVTPGAKFYKSLGGKALMLAVIGSESLENGANIAAAHVPIITHM